MTCWGSQQGLDTSEVLGAVQSNMFHESSATLRFAIMEDDQGRLVIRVPPKRARETRSDERGGDGQLGVAQNAREGDWECPRCHRIVFSSKFFCFKCGEPKPRHGSSNVSGDLPKLLPQPRRRSPSPPRRPPPSRAERRSIRQGLYGSSIPPPPPTQTVGLTPPIQVRTPRGSIAKARQMPEKKESSVAMAGADASDSDAGDVAMTTLWAPAPTVSAPPPQVNTAKKLDMSLEQLIVKEEYMGNG